MTSSSHAHRHCSHVTTSILWNRFRRVYEYGRFPVWSLQARSMTFGGAGSPCNNVACTEAYLHTKWHLDPSSRLAAVKMGRKVGELGPHLTQCRLGRGLPPYQMVSWSNHLFGHNRHAKTLKMLSLLVEYWSFHVTVIHCTLQRLSVKLIRTCYCLSAYSCCLK